MAYSYRGPQPSREGAEDALLLLKAEPLADSAWPPSGPSGNGGPGPEGNSAGRAEPAGGGLPTAPAPGPRGETSASGPEGTVPAWPGGFLDNWARKGAASDAEPLSARASGGLERSAGPGLAGRWADWPRSPRSVPGGDSSAAGALICQRPCSRARGLAPLEDSCRDSARSEARPPAEQRRKDGPAWGPARRHFCGRPSGGSGRSGSRRREALPLRAPARRCVPAARAGAPGRLGTAGAAPRRMPPRSATLAPGLDFSS